MSDKDLSNSYSAIHQHLQRHFPKTRQCVQCKRPECRTEFALIAGREYSRNREDYLELCVRCHRTYDGNMPPAAPAKLTEAVVVEARLLYATGALSIRALARKHGVDYNAMRKAIHGITWKHASEDGLLARADHIFNAVERAAA